MIDFDYRAPTSLDEAVNLLSEMNGRARLLAGGTDILVQLREGIRTAEIVIDVKKIPELVGCLPTESGGLMIGAAVPCSQLTRDRQICHDYAGFVDAARIIGGWQIQSRASIGGNICNASPAADSSPILIAYQAIVHVVGPGSKRAIPIAEFFLAPGKNALQRGEMVTGIELPVQPPKSAAAYLRFIPRYEMDIAVVGVGSWIELDESGSTIKSARIGLGAVAPTPVVATDASNWLAGRPAMAETFAQAGELAKSAAKPIFDMRGTAEFRTHLVGVLTKRTLATAVDRARGMQESNGEKA